MERALDQESEPPAPHPGLATGSLWPSVKLLSLWTLRNIAVCKEEWLGHPAEASLWSQEWYRYRQLRLRDEEIEVPCGEVTFARAGSDGSVLDPDSKLRAVHYPAGLEAR